MTVEESGNVHILKSTTAFNRGLIHPNQVSTLINGTGDTWLSQSEIPSMDKITSTAHPQQESFISSIFMYLGIFSSFSWLMMHLCSTLTIKQINCRATSKIQLPFLSRWPNPGDREYKNKIVLQQGRKNWQILIMKLLHCWQGNQDAFVSQLITYGLESDLATQKSYWTEYYREISCWS